MSSFTNSFNIMDNRKKVMLCIREEISESEIATKLKIPRRYLDDIILELCSLKEFRKEIIMYYIKTRRIPIKGKQIRELANKLQLEDISREVIELLEEGKITREPIKKTKVNSNETVEEIQENPFKISRKEVTKAKEEKRKLINIISAKMKKGIVINDEELKKLESLIEKTGNLLIDILALAEIYTSRKEYDKAIDLLEPELEKIKADEEPHWTYESVLTRKIQINKERRKKANNNKANQKGETTR